MSNSFNISPLKVRGRFKRAFLETASATFVDVVNVTGSGKLFMLGAYPFSAGQNCEVSLIIDGFSFNTLVLTIANHQHIFPSVRLVHDPTCDLNFMLSSLDSQELPFNLEFDTSLQVRVRNSSPAPQTIYCKVLYSLDTY